MVKVGSISSHAFKKKSWSMENQNNQLWRTSNQFSPGSTWSVGWTKTCFLCHSFHFRNGHFPRVQIWSLYSHMYWRVCKMHSWYLKFLWATFSDLVLHSSGEPLRAGKNSTFLGFFWNGSMKRMLHFCPSINFKTLNFSLEWQILIMQTCLGNIQGSSVVDAHLLWRLGIPFKKYKERLKTALITLSCVFRAVYCLFLVGTRFCLSLGVTPECNSLEENGKMKLQIGDTRVRLSR